MKKSYKRETAWGLLLFLCGLTGLGIYEPQALEGAKMLVVPVFAFTTLAFGADAYSKQIMNRED